MSPICTRGRSTGSIRSSPVCLSLLMLHCTLHTIHDPPLTAASSPIPLRPSRGLKPQPPDLTPTTVKDSIPRTPVYFKLPPSAPESSGSCPCTSTGHISPCMLHTSDLLAKSHSHAQTLPTPPAVRVPLNSPKRFDIRNNKESILLRLSSRRLVVTFLSSNECRGFLSPCETVGPVGPLLVPTSRPSPSQSSRTRSGTYTKGALRSCPPPVRPRPRLPDRNPRTMDHDELFPSPYHRTSHSRGLSTTSSPHVRNPTDGTETCHTREVRKKTEIPNRPGPHVPNREVPVVPGFYRFVVYYFPNHSCRQTPPFDKFSKHRTQDRRSRILRYPDPT